MFEDWCDIKETAHGEKKTLCGLTEKAGGRAIIKEDLIERVRSHYDKLEQIAGDVERLEFPGASAILKERMPRTPQARSGEMGEIIATKFIEFHTGFRIPVRRLRYKNRREIALRGDDFLGVDEDEEERLLFLKGESKSGQAVSNAVVTDAREQLSADDGRPTPISQLFVADRLIEAADEDDQALDRKIRDEIALRNVPARRKAGNAFEALVRNGLPLAPQRGFWRVMGAASYYLAGYSAMAFSLLSQREENPNFAPGELALVRLLLGDLRTLRSEARTWFRDPAHQDGAIRANLVEDVADFDDAISGILATLRRRELVRVAGQFSDQLGLAYIETRSGEPVAGTLRRSIELASGKYALVEKSREFTLVAWRPVLERHVAKQVSGVMRRDGISWAIGRQRGLGIS